MAEKLFKNRQCEDFCHILCHIYVTCRQKAIIYLINRPLEQKCNLPLNAVVDSSWCLLDRLVGLYPLDDRLFLGRYLLWLITGLWLPSLSSRWSSLWCCLWLGGYWVLGSLPPEMLVLLPPNGVLSRSCLWLIEPPVGSLWMFESPVIVCTDPRCLLVPQSITSLCCLSDVRCTLFRGKSLYLGLKKPPRVERISAWWSSMSSNWGSGCRWKSSSVSNK